MQSAAEPVAAALAADLSLLAALLIGLARVIAIKLVLGVVVILLSTALPSPKQKLLRVSLGFPAVLTACIAGYGVFSPSETLLGALAAGTLIAFNTPLRVIQFLVCPPGPRRSAGSVSPLVIVLSLIVVPAAALLRPDNSVDEDELLEYDEKPPLIGARPRGAMPVNPWRGVADAVGSFAFATSAVYRIPVQYVWSPLFLITILTVLTGGFATMSSSIVGILTGIPVSRPFNLPWFSPTLGTFWAFRWNAPIASALRAGVYDPLYNHVAVSRGAATLACFAASGAAHVIILFFGRFPPSTYWGCFFFFVLHGVAVCAERIALDRRLLPKSVLRALGCAFTVVTVHKMFLPCFTEDPRLFERVLYELCTGPRLVANSLKLLLMRGQATGIPISF
jgi:hypothetical protein